jgi:hypothetical protein
VNITSNKSTACWYYDPVRVNETDLRYVHIHQSATCLGTYIKMKRATIIFVMSLRLSVRIEKFACRCKDFNKNWC